MEDCPKYIFCDAPICPLDPEREERSYLKGEKICFYMLEYVKSSAEAKFQGSTARKMGKVMGRAIPGLISRYAPLKTALERASNYGTRWRQPGK